VIERQADLGGTWLLNSYPGCRVDTLSFLFQYKFEKRYKWKDYFAAREDTQEYLHHVARKYGVENKIQYNREVVAADWNEDSATWKLRINNKREQRTEFLDANAIISASGLFATAEEKPDIPGLEKFRGHMFHTTNWDHSVDETGLRVALIGTGSTGTQLAPLVAAKAKQLTVFQRNPNWIASYEGYDASVSDHATWLFDNMPYYWNWYCYAAYFRSLDLAPLQVRDLEYEATGGCVNERNDKIRDALTKFVHTKMAKRPDLIEKLIPKIPPLVRRLVVDNGFYETLMEPHVDLVTEGIQEITETGIIDRTGKHREFDLIVLAAGFKTSKYFFPCEYTGRNGAKLEDIFSKDGARSYLGMTMPGFPNLFTLYGPNHQPRGGSLYSWAEIWCRYAVSSVVWMIENNAQDMEVKRDVFDAYQDRLDAENKKLIWEWKGASYYVNEHGRQAVNMPWTTSDYHAMVIKPNMDDFNVRSRPLVNGVFLKLG
jgi:4-hydroxyacetophenone monooxygenase